MTETAAKRPNGSFKWPDEGVTRVPYRLYSDPDIYALEQERIFRGPIWNFLCLEIDIPDPGDFKTSFVGEIPVVVTRDQNGDIHAMVNRCAHKGALVCYKPRGNVRELTCVYHNWVYDLRGNLTGVAFGRGVAGQGGLAAEFDRADHGLERLRVEVCRGLVMGTFSKHTPPFADYIGAELLGCIDRVFIRPLRVLGYHSQVLPNNWKLYAENNKDAYHASLLHVFHNTFGVVRPTMGGGVRISDSGWHHHSYTERVAVDDDEIGKEKVRSLAEGYTLDECQPITGDHLDAPLTWNGKTDVSHLRGQTVRLRFDLYKADLYAIKF